MVPSLWSEGTSLAAIESVAAGVPVVATNVGGLANVVVPHFNGVVTNTDAASIASSIERLLADETLYLRMAQQCLAMREAFSRERWRNDVLNVLKRAGLLSGECAAELQPLGEPVRVRPA